MTKLRLFRDRKPNQSDAFFSASKLFEPGVLLTGLLICLPLIAAEPSVNIQELPSSSTGIERGGSPSVPGSEFEFARMVYNGGFDWPRWRADWPDAEYHFSQGLKRLTRIDISDNSSIIELTDPRLFEFPWLYVVEVGYWALSSTESSNLREYLLRGGFLMVDDFHGDSEWLQFISVMRRVFPDRRIEKLEASSPLFNLHYDIQQRKQIPGIRSIMNNRTWEKVVFCLAGSAFAMIMAG